MRLTPAVVITRSCLALFAIAAPASAQVNPDQAEKIRAAAPQKARAAPKKPRTVLIWNTPPTLMEKDPHKGYCIPFGQCAFEVLGQKTGAFKPVVSDDLAVYLPERLKQFDAIVMNNSSGPWIQPTDPNMAKLRSAGADKQAVERLLRRSLLDFVSGGGGIVACHETLSASALSIRTASIGACRTPFSHQSSVT